MTNKNKKYIILSTFIALTLGMQMLAMPMTMAEGPAPTTTPETTTNSDSYGLKDLKYNVSKELKLPDTGQPKTYFSDTKYPPIISFILSVINYATGIIGTIAMIIFIIAGFMLIIAQGDQTKIDKAKEIIKYAVYGLIITFMSYVITIFVQSLFITQSQTTPTTPAQTQPK